MDLKIFFHAKFNENMTLPGELIQFRGRESADSKIKSTPPVTSDFRETLKERLSNIFKYQEGIFNIYCQKKDMEDFLNLQSKLEPPPTLTKDYTHFFYKKLRSSLSTESFLIFLLFYIVMRTMACCIFTLIGQKVEDKFLPIIEELLIKEVSVYFNTSYPEVLKS